MLRLTTFGLYSKCISLATDAIDRGWFGLAPLDRHIVICGCPRSGTTLLHLMLTVAMRARTFGREVRASHAAKYALRNHPTLITKHPNDIFELDNIRKIYKNRSAQPFFLVNIRDPRDILVSRHAANKDDYYVSVERWRRIYAAINDCKHDKDVHIVRFEDLIARPDSTGQEISTFTGAQLTKPLRSFCEAASRSFDTTAMNGVRPLDPSAIGKWRAEMHRDRVRFLLDAMPGFSNQLIEWNYELNDEWIGALA